MANRNMAEKAIQLVEKWGAGKIAIGSKYKLKGSDRILELVECEGYPNGKFLFNDGEEFNVGKYFNAFFIENTLNLSDEQETTPVYDEDVWDEMHKKFNKGGDKNIITTFASSQENEGFHDIMLLDVSKIIEEILDNKTAVADKMLNVLQDYLNENNFPLFTREKLYVLFGRCQFVKTNHDNVLKVKVKDKEIGYLVADSNKYIFVPKNIKLSNEYSYENDNSIGFYYAAESYLDVALSTINNYKEHFIPVYNNSDNRNKQYLGYQMDSTIKTLLAFSCECYLKALLMSSGKSINDMKDLGHSLTVLFTSLDDETIGKVFSYMERNGYNISLQKVYETNDLTEKFMLDLAKNDDAFTDIRYSAENDKNTDYDFLYRFALSLRNSTEKELFQKSPFSNSIEENIHKK